MSITGTTLRLEKERTWIVQAACFARLHAFDSSPPSKLIINLENKDRMGQRMENMRCLFGSGKANTEEVNVLYNGRKGICVHYVDDPSLNIFKTGSVVALFYEVIRLNLCSRFIENIFIAALAQGFSRTLWVSKFSGRRHWTIS